MKITTILTLCALLMPCVFGDIITLKTKERLDGMVIGYKNEVLTVRLLNTTGELRIPIDRIESFSVMRSLREPTQPVPLNTAVQPTRVQQMRQRLQDYRRNAKAAQLSRQHEALLKQGDALRQRAYNTQIHTPERASYMVRQQRRTAVQSLFRQAEQAYAQARQIEQELKRMGFPVSRSAPPPGSIETRVRGGSPIPKAPQLNRSVPSNTQNQSNLR